MYDLSLSSALKHAPDTPPIKILLKMVPIASVYSYVNSQRVTFEMHLMTKRPFLQPWWHIEPRRRYDRVNDNCKFVGNVCTWNILGQLMLVISGLQVKPSYHSYTIYTIVADSGTLLLLGSVVVGVHFFPCIA